MKRLITTLKINIGMLLCALCIISCTQESLLDSKDKNYAGKPIQLIVSGPDNHAVSRVAAPKNEFNVGDIIHVSTTFTYVAGTNGTPTVYACLKYNGTGWDETTNPKTFTWPWNAETAQFEAYYIPATKTYLNKDPMTIGTIPIKMADLSEPTDSKKWADPLYASQGLDQPVAAGSSVYLQFNHLLTKITFINLNKPANGAEPIKGEELRLLVKEGAESDQVTFELTAEHKLTHKFEAVTGYIAGKVNATKEVSFLLPPTDDIGSKVKLAYKDMSAYHSFKLESSLFPKGLEAGKHYTIDVTLLADNHVSDAIKEEDWNQDVDAVKVNAKGIQEYLKSIRDGEECYVTDVTTSQSVQVLTINKEIIGGNETDVVAQIRDIDFDGQEFTPVNLRPTIIFQGNGHKIQNVKITNTIRDDSYPDIATPTGTLCKSLFGKNNGTIKNIVIETASFETGSTQEVNAGILVSNNVGTIENVTIKGVKIKGTAATTMGIIVGTNAGSVSKCHITGAVSIAIEKTNADCYVGGLIGSTTGGSLESCSIAGDNTATLSMAGTYGTCYVGGLVGNSERSIKNCFSNLNIELTATAATFLYVGGVAGNLSAAEAATATAIGTIKINASLTGTKMYIGGFAGYVANGTLTDCAATGDITEAPSSSNVGGLVGTVEASNHAVSIDYSSATGATLPSGAGALIGTTTDGNSITIDNSFAINNAALFIANDPSSIATITNCHQKGITVGTTDDSFDPSDKTKWTNTPAIYGKDSKGNPIYYLIRKL